MPLALAILLLTAGALAMLAVPFIPMWREWRHPTDHAPLPVRADDDNAVDFFARQLRARLRVARPEGGKPAPRTTLERAVRHSTPVYAQGDLDACAGTSFSAVLAEGDLDVGADSEITEWAHAEGTVTLAAGTTALRRVSAGDALIVERECCFERLNAPTIRFGADTVADAGAPAPRREPIDVATLPGAFPRGGGLVRIARATVLPPNTHWRGSLVVAGSLTLADGAVLTGSAKAYDGVILGRDARIEGALVCRKSIHLLERSRVHGPVVSEADIFVAPGVTIGVRGTPTTVTAENIMAAEGVVVHGTVWAHDVGIVWGREAT